jgi:hypothetical protein
MIMGLVKEKTEKERRLQKQIKEIQNFFLEQHIPCSKEEAEKILKFEERGDRKIMLKKLVIPLIIMD